MNKSFETGTLLLRVVTGIIFFVHGLSKFQGLEGTTQFFQSIGIPAFMVYVIATIELVGGVLIFFGLATRIIGVLFAITLVGASSTFAQKLSALHRAFEQRIVTVVASSCALVRKFLVFVSDRRINAVSLVFFLHFRCTSVSYIVV